MDTLTTASAAITTIPMQPVALGGTGAIILVLLFNYREVIIALFKKLLGVGRDEERKTILADVQTLKQSLTDHTEKEEKYWAENEKRLAKLETDNELNKQQTKSQHDETLRILGQQNERLGDMAESIKMLTQVLLNERQK